MPVAALVFMRRILPILAGGLLALSCQATVRVFVQDTNGLAWISYQCTAGEVVRSFALDVTVDHGVILGVTNFLRGPSAPGAPGYGIFPSAFRDHVTVTSGTNADWSSVDYNPIATVSDSPTNTLPGLYSSGVTLEFGALWDPTSPAAIPPPAGTLCAVRISQMATVTLAANSARGGLVAAPSDVILTTQFSSATVDPEIAITSATVNNGIITILFKGGQLETALTPSGPWAGTGNSSGSFSEAATLGAKFYRVHHF
jgi:hypothetical protein